jgi:hypothetical protein
MVIQSVKCDNLIYSIKNNCFQIIDAVAAKSVRQTNDPPHPYMACDALLSGGGIRSLGNAGG